MTCVFSGVVSLVERVAQGCSPIGQGVARSAGHRRSWLARLATVMAILGLAAATSAAALAQTASTTTVSSSPNPSAFAQSVTFKARVTPSSGSVAPTGTVTFTDTTTNTLLGTPALTAITQTKVEAGGGHNCSVGSDGGVSCWGWGDDLQLGMGEFGFRTVPTEVVGLPGSVTAVATGGYHSCALTTDGAVYCWGRNLDGQAGVGPGGFFQVVPAAVLGLPDRVVAITAGLKHTCALTTAGTAYCWGWNAYRQLGDGSTSIRLSAIAVTGLPGSISAITAGSYHSCALTTGGAVYCWGRNDDGQLGDGTTAVRTGPVAVSGLSTGVTAIDAGGRFNCALTTGGEVKCWGSNGSGQLGDGSLSDRQTPVTVSGLSSDVAAIGAGDSHACGILTSGAARCWGSNVEYQLGDGTTLDRTAPVAVSGLLSGVAAITLGDVHTCALTTAGAVKCWGNAGNGRIGDGLMQTAPTPVSTVPFRVATLSTSSLSLGAHTIQAYFVGSSSLNASSATTTQMVSQPTTTALVASVNPSVSRQSVTFTATVSSATGVPSGSVQFFDGATSLGTGTLNGSGVASLTTTDLGVATHAITAVYAATTDFASSTSSAVSQVVNQGSTTTTLVSATNPSASGQSVTLTATVAPVAPAGGTPSGTVQFFDGVIALGTALLSSGEATLSTSGLTVGSHSVTAVYSGSGSFAASTSSDLTQTVNLIPTTTVLASTPSGTAKLGQSVALTATVSSGSGTPGGSVTFNDGATALGTATLDGTGVATLSVSSLALGPHTLTATYTASGNYDASTSAGLSLAIDPSDSTTTVSSSPNPSAFGQSVTFTANVLGGANTPTGMVSFLDGTTEIGSGVLSASSWATGIASGDYHSCARTPSGGVKCWGLNQYGQLGNGSYLNRSTPVDVTNLGSDVVAVAGGVGHTCALTSAGGVKCWGFNGYLQLGNGTSNGAAVPVDVVGLASGVVAITAGGYHSCALTAAGGVKCWGYNAQGQLGNGTTNSAATPVNVDGLGSGIVAIAGGVLHTCALTSSGGVKCWGWNASGQLGNGTTSDQTTPVDVSSLNSGIISIDAGGYHSCALNSAGGIKCWGQNNQGQLGNGNTTNQTIPDSVMGIGTDSIAIATGDSHTCALNSAGGVKCWGWNGDGQLGIGNLASQDEPVDVVGLNSGVTALAAGVYHGCILTLDGGAKCWGGNGSGQLGDGSTTTRLLPVDIVGSSERRATASLTTSALSAGPRSISAAYAGDGNHVGSTSASLLQTVNQAATVTTIAALPGSPSVSGQSVTFTATVSSGAGTPSGSVEFFDGSNSLGTATLSSGEATLSTSAMTVGSHSVTAVYAGTTDFATSTSSAVSQVVDQAATTTTIVSGTNPAILGQSVTLTATVAPVAPAGGTPSGTVQFFDGATLIGSGTLGSGQATLSTSGLTLGTHSVTAVYAGDASFTASTSSTLTQSVNRIPTTAVLTASPSASARLGERVTLTATVTPDSGLIDGNIRFYDGTTELASMAIGNSGVATIDVSTLSLGVHSLSVRFAAVFDFASSTSADLSFTINPSDSTTTISSSPNPSAFSQAVTFSARVRPETALVAPTGTLTVTDATTSTVLGTPVLTPIPQTKLSAGYYHTCSVDIDGGVSCWGENAYGVLGDGSTTNRLAPVPVSGLSSGVVDVAAGLSQTCALKSDATVLCWGGLNAGPLSEDLPLASVTPVAVPGLSDVSAIVSGAFHNCALTTGGAVSCWGLNADGQLGNGTTDDQSAPVAVSGLSSGVTALASGAWHTCALTSAGAVLCWGGNYYGELGDGTTTASLEPVAVTGLSSAVVAITAGERHTCALKGTGEILCWGDNSSGQLGDDTFVNQAAPVAVSSIPGTVTTIEAGMAHNCALTSAGEAYCWGFNNHGSLGNNSMTTSGVPVAVSGVSDAVNITAGAYHTCVSNSVGAVSCWGGNISGELGDGTAVDNRLTPVATLPPVGRMATLSISSLSAGVHTIQASYAGDANVSASNGTTSHTVNPAATTTAVVSSASPTVSGQSVTFTATVSSAAGTPGGSIEFFDGSTSLGTATLSSGEATLSTSALTVGSHSVTAVYAGTTDFETSTSSALSQVVNQGSTTTTLASSSNPSASGQSVTLTATVAAVGPAGGTPSGTVQFFDGATLLGTATLNSGEATLSTSGLTVGSHSVTAVYSGSGSFAASTSSDLTQTVNLIPTTTVLTSSPSGTAKLGEGVTLSATVSSSSGTPGGSVSFFDGSTSLGTGTLNGSGVATLSVSSLALGAHSLTATYAASGNYDASTSAGLSLAINKSDSTTTVSSSPNPSAFGQSVTITASVLGGANTPTGMVSFLDGTTEIGSGVLSASSWATGIASGDYHSCARTPSGGVKCWGRNEYGQLGNGSTANSSTPVDVTNLGSDVVALAGGVGHTCALTSAGGVKCWGFNGYSQLGDGTSNGAAVPVDVVGLASGVVAITAGGYHSCALTAAGGVKCWGYNAQGQLGNGTTNSAATPVNVDGLGSGIVAIAGGVLHTCALTSSGGVKCWGWNASGQLGNGTTSDQTTPVDVSSLNSGIISIDAGGYHSCALNSAGGIKCWGQNNQGQLGNGNTTNQTIPDSVMGIGTDSIAIATGDSHTCALNSAGGVKCWGWNGDGQLGIGNLASQDEPVDVVGLNSGVTALAAGVYHSCILTLDGGAKCWGGNGSSQLGDGSTTTRLLPVDIVGSSERRSTASLTTSSLSAGAHTIQASYAGDANVSASNGTTSQTVTPGSNVITFPALANTAFTGVPPIPAATASSNLTVTYASTTAAVCTATGAGAISFVAAGTCTIRASQAGNANFAAATPVSKSFTVTPGSNVITFPALANTAFTSAPPIPAATATSNLTVTYASTTAAVCTATSGGAISFVSAGTCTIRASQAGNANFAAATSVTKSFTVTPGSNVIAFPVMADRAFTSTPPIPAATASSNLTVTYATTTPLVCTATGAGAITFVSAGACTITASQAGNANFVAATAVSRTFNVTLGVNTITFPVLANTAFTSAPPVPAATSSSGFAVTYASSTGAVCLVTPGGSISFNNAGTCSITASQAGSANFDAAVDVTRSFIVTPGVNTITFPALANTTFASAPPVLAATSSSNLPVTYASTTASVCTATSTGAITFVKTGTCTITASQAGNANFVAATAVSRSFTVTPGSNIITFPALANTAFTATPPIPAATSSSNLAVTYASTTAPVCTVTGVGAITFVKAGTCSITASQAGNASFAAATPVSRSFTVTPGANTITFPALANTAFTATPPIPAATSSSNLAVTYASTTAPVCTATSGGVITFVKAGTCSITASQAGNASFAAATPVSRSFTVTPGANTITFPALANTAFTETPPVPAATSSSGLAVTYASTTAPVCTVTSGGVITFVKAGTCSITASQAGNASFAAATPVSRSFTILASVTVVATSSGTPAAYGVPITFTATVTVPAGGTPTGTVTFKDGATTLGTSTLANGLATLTTAALEVGTHTIIAAYGGSATHGSAMSGPLAQVVTKAGPAVTLTVSPDPVEAGQPVALVASLSVLPAPALAPGGSVVFRDGASVIGSTSILAGKATLSTSTLAPGGHSLTASYVGDANFLPSTSPAMPLTVQRSCRDAFASATVFADATGSTSGSTLAATGEVGERKHGGDNGAVNSVWCKWTAPAAGRVTVETTGSTFDTTLAIYTGASLGQLTEVAANDNIDATTRQSRVSFEAVQGRAYMIAIDGAGTARGNYVLGWTQAPAAPQLLASVLPSSRSTLTGAAATAFATIINTGSAVATQCRIALPTGFPAAFSYQTASPANALTGTVNTPVDIQAGAVQSFVISITPTSQMEATEIPLVFDCANTQPAPSVSGLNRFTLSASATPSPDIIAIASTVSGDGIVSVPLSGSNVFAAASLNIGAAGTLTVQADDGGRGLPLAITLCRNDPATGACAGGAVPTTSLSVVYGANDTVTFTIFVKATGAVAFEPALNRVQLRWKTADGITRGVTSAAVRTK
jgi:alpha-tubulin suppressor-like RCC1 family protein